MQDLTTFIAHHPFLWLAMFILFILLILIEFIRAKRNVFNIGPAKATQMINHDNAAIIDIRSVESFRKGHIIHAVSFLPQEIKTPAKKLEKFKGRTLILICQTGMESQKLAANLLKQGYNAYSLAGGMRAWMEAQMPVVKE